MKTPIRSMLLILSFLLISSLIFSSGRSDQASQIIDATARIKPDRILLDINRLAANDDARQAGLPGEADAFVFAREQLSDVARIINFESFPVTSFQSNGSGASYSAGDDFIPMEARAFYYSPSTKGVKVVAPLVDAGLGRSGDLAAVNLKGKIALIKRGEIYFSQKAVNAEKAGAVGVIIYNNAEDTVIGTLVASVTIPVVAVSGRQGDEIVSHLNAGIDVTGSLWTDTVTSPGESSNLTAIQGRESDRFLVIGAHIDSVDTPGANDNASGAAVLLESARVLSGIKLPFAVRYVLFGAEEIGLLGSREWVHNLSIEEKALCIGMINLDTVGGGELPAVFRSSAGSPAQLAAAARRAISILELKSAGVGGSGTQVSDASDHQSFAAAGIPAVFISSVPFDRIHTDQDTPENINRERLIQAASLTIGITLLLK